MTYLYGSIINQNSIGSMYVSGNAVVTVITTKDVWTDLNLGIALASSNIYRWSLTNTTIGELTYDGLEPFSGFLVATISALGSGGKSEYHFRVVKNGSVLTDAVETVINIGSDVASATLIVPISVVNGDAIRMQVENTDNIRNITVTYISVNIQ